MRCCVVFALLAAAMLELEEFGGADGHGGVTVIRWFDLIHFRLEHRLQGL